jgi:E3 ubiquitin-protein ligase FANCL
MSLALASVVVPYKPSVCACQALAAYQALWDELQLLDLSARVLHPPGTPSYSCCSRQLALPRGAAVEVTLRPAAPRVRPLVRFTGTSSAVAQLQQAWFSEGHVWDTDVPLRDNLEQALQVRLLRPQDPDAHGRGSQDVGWGGRLVAEAAARLVRLQGVVLDSQSLQQLPGEAAGGAAGQEAGEEEDAHLGECAICYAYLLQPAGAVPTEVCPGEHCRRAFHVSCLAEWLQGHPNSRRCFGTLFGDCPYCNGAIGVKVL